ncbi:MAG: transporter substrate-binding domain-containing protein [Beijerinckiaceae bacterium]|nr:transporter substrate-binding domain-containing protein [Beijerinckiaceae bacterium]MCI0735117.1 transporter substrate-binding domain-containing protein [Beijerinckiaceae bacterium]
MRVNGIYIKIKLSLVTIAALVLAFPQPARLAPGVFVPSFWDLHRRAAKPDLSGLRSLRFLTEDDYPPFHFALPDGHLTGFDVDLARAICEELNIPCTIQARRFDTLIDALNNDEGDAMIAAIRIDAQSRAKLDFSGAYYTTPARFVSLAAVEYAPATPEGLRGKTVGVQARSAHEAYLETFFPETVRKPYESQDLLREALRKGDIDTIFGDGIALSLWLDSQAGRNCCHFRGGPFLDANFFGEGVGIAVKKGNSKLRQVLDYTLAALAGRGTYTTLYLKYFPLSFY